jgi:type IV secretion system protein TrbL
MTGSRFHVPLDVVHDSIGPDTLASIQHGIATLPTDATLVPLAAVFTDWIANFFTYILTGILGFIGELIANGMRTFIIFDSPYSDPTMQAAFQHNLDIFPQLLVIMFMAGVATKPFADQREVTNFMLVWKALKVIIFVAVARQIMHFGLLLTNAIIRHIFTANYGAAFGPEVLKSSLDGAAASGAGVIIGALILSMVSVAGILLALGVFVLREFLFNATFILLPVLGAMLFLDFGPLRYTSEIAKTALRATAYMLLAGIVMAGLLQTGAAAAGAYADMAGQGAAAAQSQQAGDPGFGEVLEAYLFWLIGLVAPALVGIKSAAMAGLSPRRISGRQGAKSKSSSQSSSSTQSDEKSTRTALMEQARHGTSKGLRGIDKRTKGVGSTAVGKAGSAAGRTKSTIGNVATSVVSEEKVEKGKRIGNSGKKGGKRVINDAHAGADYATRNLHQSPVDWAEAGLERYRDNPVVDTSDDTGPKQRELNDWSDSSSNKGQSK